MIFDELNISIGTILECTCFKDDLIQCKCLCCKKNCQQKFDEHLKERLFNRSRFSNHSKNKFISLFWKNVYPYENIGDWEKFNGTSLPEKEDFYCHLNIENITYAGYVHGKAVCKDFEMKHLAQYHDSYVQSDTLLLAGVFENFRKTYIKICELDLARFLTAPQLTWQAASKKTSVKLDLLTDIDMLLMVEKRF